MERTANAYGIGNAEGTAIIEGTGIAESNGTNTHLTASGFWIVVLLLGHLGASVGRVAITAARYGSDFCKRDS